MINPMQQMIIEEVFSGNDNYGFARLGLDHLQVRGDRDLDSKIISSNGVVRNTTNVSANQKEAALGKKERCFP